jgi:RNA polymerase sigma-70 factor (ECF subfamily)
MADGSAERSALLALVGERVELRFALDAPSFVDRLVDQAREAALGADKPLLEHVRRLSLDDLYLATACSQGDEKAWEELTRRHGGFIRTFALRFLREPNAGDLADQVLADLWQRRKIARYRGRSTLRTWLGSVVANAAVNAGMASWRFVPLEEEVRAGDPPAAFAEPGASQAEALLARVVAEAIDGLPAGEKVVLRLYYEQGLTLDQMGVGLRTSKAALSRRLARIRAGLRQTVESLAQRHAGASVDALRAGIDLGRLEWDLSALVGRGRSEQEEALSKSTGAMRFGKDGDRG